MNKIYVAGHRYNKEYQIFGVDHSVDGAYDILCRYIAGAYIEVSEGKVQPTHSVPDGMFTVMAYDSSIVEINPEPVIHIPAYSVWFAIERIAGLHVEPYYSIENKVAHHLRSILTTNEHVAESEIQHLAA